MLCFSVVQAIPASPQQNPSYQLTVPLLTHFVLPLIQSVLLSIPYFTLYMQ